jgi:HK97 family phage major capsid protein
MNKIVTRPAPEDKNLMEFGGLERRREIIQTALARSKAQRAAKERAPSTIEERIRRINELTDATLPAPKFKSLAENIIAIVVAERGGPVDPRLIRAPAGANINSPPDGGFLIEEQYSQELVALAYEESLIADLCDRRPTAKPLAAVKVPGIDETSRADGSRFGGVLSYWSDESKSTPTTLPRFKNVEFSAKKIIALVFGTDELLADAPMFEAHVKRALKAEFGFKLDLGVLSGTGAGQPLGILNSPALITVAAETGQTPATVVRANVNKMWKRLPAPSRYNAVWLANEDMDEQLETLNGNPGTYIPAGVNGNKFPLLKGRPVITVEQCPVVGTVGDLVLADLDHYVIVDGGMKYAMSLHVRFDTDQALLRFVMRVDGRSGFSTPITPYNGGLTRSPFVALASR